jgi:hypothetical protein
MSGCDFVVSGENFDIDRYLESSPFAAGAEIFRRGDATELRSHPTNRRSGFRTEIFEFEGLGIEKVISKSSEFLHRHRDAIAHAKNWHGVEQCEIAALMAWFEDTAALPLQLPAPFLQLLGSIGVSLSIDICATPKDSA